LALTGWLEIRAKYERKFAAKCKYDAVAGFGLLGKKSLIA
jgi:hypothetical protein